MENASKALLIAGAILIAILLIGIAMMVFGNINGIVGIGTQQVDELEITGFNKPFKQYEGNSVSGSNVKALLEKIQASNTTYTGDNSRQISVKYGNGTEQEIGANYRYKVEFATNASGFIHEVTITKK